MPFLVTEFVDGKSLDTFKEELLKDKPRFLRMMLELLDGNHACHQKGIIHRDLKPQNILIDNNGQLRIIDFGIAKTDIMQTSTRYTMGTPHYMAPEQVSVEAPITYKVDTYSLGIIFWEFLTGRVPFNVTDQVADPVFAIAFMHVNKPPPIDELAADPFNNRFLELICGMLAKKPENRPEIPSIIDCINKELERLSNPEEKPSYQNLTEGSKIGEI